MAEKFSRENVLKIIRDKYEHYRDLSEDARKYNDNEYAQRGETAAALVATLYYEIAGLEGVE